MIQSLHHETSIKVKINKKDDSSLHSSSSSDSESKARKAAWKRTIDGMFKNEENSSTLGNTTPKAAKLVRTSSDDASSVDSMGIPKSINLDIGTKVSADNTPEQNRPNKRGRLF